MTRIPVDDVREAIQKLNLGVEVVANPLTGGWSFYKVLGNPGARIESGLKILELSHTDLALMTSYDVVAKVIEGLKAVDALERVPAQPATVPIDIFSRVRLTDNVWKGLARSRTVTQLFRTGMVTEIIRGAHGSENYQVLHDNGATSKWPRSSLELLRPEDDTGGIPDPKLDFKPAPTAVPEPGNEPEPEEETPLTGSERFQQGDAAWKKRRKSRKRAEAIEQVKRYSGAKLLLDGQEVGEVKDLKIKPIHKSEVPLMEMPSGAVAAAVTDLQLAIHSSTAVHNGLKKIVVDRDVYNWLLRQTSPPAPSAPPGSRIVLVVDGVEVIPDAG